MDINTTSESPLILVACSLRKRPVASEARSLYVGELFKKSKKDRREAWSRLAHFECKVWYREVNGLALAV